MPAILKHVDCPSCGTRHHFCLPIGDLTPGRDYEYVCPNTAKKASLRSASPAEVCPSAPQGAVALTPGKYTPPEGTDSGPVKHWAAQNSDHVAPAGAGLHDVQHEVHEIGDEVHDLSNRVGKLEQRANAASTTQPTTPVSAPSTGSPCLGEVLPKVKDLAGKVGGMEKLSEIVEELKETQE
jgi:hypothetical protein